MANTLIVPLAGPQVEDDINEAALPVAVSLASRLDAEVVLLSAVDLFFDMDSTGVPRPVYATDALPESKFANEMRERTERMVADREAYLDRVTAAFGSNRARKLIRYGDPAQAILVLAGEVENPIVAIGSHSRAGLQRLLLGSVAFSVVSQASCPVVVVPVRDDAAPFEDYALSTVVIPLDGSSLAERVIDDGLGRLGPQGLTVHLVHVLSEDEVDYGRAREYLEEIAVRLRHDGYDVGWTIREGDPVDEVTSVCDDVDADLIAVTSHGRSGVREKLFGSVAEQLVRDARRPTLLLRPGASYWPHPPE